MKFYELSYLAPPELSEENLNDLKEKIISFLEKEGGVLNEIKNPFKKTLGYPIKEKKVAFLVTLNFHSNPDQVRNFEKKMKSEPEILRYSISAKAKPGKEVSKTLSSPSAPKVQTKDRWRPRIEKSKRPKVELKEIEKKLEEILGR